MKKKVLLKIKRQESPKSQAYWEEFEIDYREKLNIIICLTDIRENPINKQGKKTTPVAFEQACLEEVCGSCTMLINGKPRQACSTLVDDLLKENPNYITLAPLTKFPLVRDLVVDRSKIFDNFKKVKGWVPVDGTFFIGRGPRMSPNDQQIAYDLARCIACGCCMESCPQFNESTDFIGPASINQVRLFNMHPIGKMHKHERLEALLKKGGITTCGNAQNCVRVCPKEIPLTTSIATLNWDTSIYGIVSWLKK